MSYLNHIHYHDCYACKKSCSTTQTHCNDCMQNHVSSGYYLPHSNGCGCNTCLKEISPCSIPNPTCCNAIEVIGSVDNTNCNPISCTEGCLETIKSSCVVLETYCLLNDCNCANEPITLDMFLKELCKEIANMKSDIDCLKQHIPQCSGTVNCGVAVFTNSQF